MLIVNSICIGFSFAWFLWSLFNEAPFLALLNLAAVALNTYAVVNHAA